MPIIAVVEWSSADGREPRVLLVPEITEARRLVRDFLNECGYLNEAFVEFLEDPETPALDDVAWLRGLCDATTAPWVTFYSIGGGRDYGWADEVVT